MSASLIVAPWLRCVTLSWANEIGLFAVELGTLRVVRADDLDALELGDLGEERLIAAFTAGSSVPCGAVNTICADAVGGLVAGTVQKASCTCLDSLSGWVKSVW